MKVEKRIRNIKKEEIDLESIREEILYTDSIYRYIRDVKGHCVSYCNTNGGEIAPTSKQSFIIGYIKELENNIVNIRDKKLNNLGI